MALARIFALNVGNSNISIGVFDGSRLVRTWRLSTDINRTSDELGLMLRSLLIDAGLTAENLSGVVVGSVVPSLDSTMVETCRRYLGLDPLMVGPGMKTGLPIRCDDPKSIGADRIVNAIAAVQLYGPPVIVVKLGTATTLCVIDDAGVYIGGTIAPGIRTSVDALSERTAKLPRIELTYPTHVIGKNTITSMQSGTLYGAVGLVDGLVERVKSEVPLSFSVVATGGLAQLVSAHSRTIEHIVPHLTLLGLQLLWQRNRESSGSTH